MQQEQGWDTTSHLGSGGWWGERRGMGVGHPHSPGPKEIAGQQARLTLNMNPGGRSRRPAPLPLSTVPFTVAEKVSTTTAGRELWRGRRAGQ